MARGGRDVDLGDAVPPMGEREDLVGDGDFGFELVPRDRVPQGAVRGMTTAEYETAKKMIETLAESDSDEAARIPVKSAKEGTRLRVKLLNLAKKNPSWSNRRAVHTRCTPTDIFVWLDAEPPAAPDGGARRGRRK